MKDVNVVLADIPGFGRAQLCECNCVHLTIGPVTLNMEAGAFAQSATLIRDAMDRLTKILDAKNSAAETPQFTLPNQSRLTH